VSRDVLRPFLGAGGGARLQSGHDQAQAHVPRVGGGGLDGGVHLGGVPHGQPGEQPGFLPVGLPDPVQGDAAVPVGVPGVGRAVGPVGNLLAEHEPAPLYDEGQLLG